MPQTTFDPAVHGFAFANTWQLDEEERRQLREIFAPYLLWSGILGAVVFGLLGALLVPFVIPGVVALGLIGAVLFPLGILILRRELERHLAPGYGLCGGMCFAALDFFNAKQAIPRGQGVNDQPAPRTHLRGYIWKRQMNSIVSDGARFAAWLFNLNYVPPAWPLRGGSDRLAARSRKEWEKLKAGVDAGDPVPIGLVYATKHITDNHQVLAIGYDEENQAQSTIYVYDPNCPDTRSTIRLQFGEHALDGGGSCGTGPPLRGLFCEIYAPADPTEALEPS